MPRLPYLALATALLAAGVGSPLAAAQATEGDPEAAQRYGGEGQGFARPFGDLLEDLDAFWRAAFEAVGMTYQSPGVVPITGSVDTACGPKDVGDFALFCGNDATIYYSVPGLADHEETFGDFAPVVVMAHEWGHEVQWLLDVPVEASSSLELQADCLAGAYALAAEQRGLLDPGDVTEAVMSSADAGDDPVWPQDRIGAHGTNDQRISAFMRGYLDGVGGCRLPFGGDAGTSAPPTAATANRRPPLALDALVPQTLALPPGQPFRLYDEGVATFDGVVANSADPTTAGRRLRQWGWQDNYYRVFASDNPPGNEAGWVEISIDRFATAAGAADALPAYADERRARTGHRPIDLGLFADQTEAMAGSAYNGNEVTIFARRANMIVRATGIAPNGDPTADVIEAILIPLAAVADEPRVVSPELFSALPSERDLPPGLRQAEEHARSAGTIASNFPNAVEAERLFRTWNWRESAARVFTGTTGNRTFRFEVSVFRFADQRTATDALSYFLDARRDDLGLSETASPPARADEARMIEGQVGDAFEATVYLRRGVDVFRITASGEGDPVADLAAMLGSW